MREERSRFRTAVWLAGAFAGLLVLHLGLAFSLPGPILYEDTLGYLTIARHLAGWGPPALLSGPNSFYHFGYSLLLAPLYPLLDSSWKVFRAALVLDSVLASLQAIVLYALARGLSGLRRSLSWMAALAAALYPSWLLQSSFVWTESLFALVFSVYVLLAFQAVRRGGAGWLAGFAFAGSFLYMVHPRGLGIVAATVLLLLAWGWRRRFGPGATAAALAVCLGTFAAARALNGVLFDALWVAPPSASEGNLLGRLLDPAVWIGALPQRAAGQLWYLLAATLGLFAVGLWELGRRALRRDGEPEGAEAARVALLGFAAVFAASVTIMIPAYRSDHLVYGRYNEALLGPFLVAGIAALLTAPRRQILTGLGSAAALCLVLGLALPRLLPPAALSHPPMVLNVTGALLWSRPETLGMLRTTAGAVGAAGLLALLALASRRAAVAALAAFFAVSAVLVAQRQLLPFCRSWSGLFTLQETLGPLTPEAVAYERSGLATTYGFNAYQFWLDRTRFRLFDAAAGEKPADELVIASGSWGLREPGYRRAAAEARVDQTLWVAPGSLQADLARRGLLLPGGAPEPLPEEALRSRIERLDGAGEIAARSGEPLRLRFRLAHAGRGAAWVPSVLAGSPWGSVRLAARWFPDGAAVPVEPGGFRGELPRLLRPGESVEVEITVPVQGADGRRLALGRYELEVGPVQEGVRWFTDAGDRPLRIAVEVGR